MTRTESMQQARGTAADLAAVNPVLLDGQIVVERDTLRLKVGDGVRAWTQLPYVAPTLPTLATVATSGSYADLSGKPAIPTTPAAIGAQPAGDYATHGDLTAAVANAVTALVNGSPGALDTLRELADALGDDANFASTVAAQIAAKYTKPGSGIPSTDLAAAVQTALTSAGTAVQPAGLASAVTTAEARANHTGTQTASTITGLAAVATSGLASDVGLGAVNNTADTAKPVSTAQAAAIAAATTTAEARANHTGTQPSSTITGLAAVATSGLASDVGLGSVSNTSDASKPVSTAQAAAIAAVSARTLSGPTATLTATGTLTAGLPNALDATGASITATLPTPTVVGQLLPVERVDTSTTNVVSVTGTVRGVTTTVTLPAMGVIGEGLLFEAETLTSWRPVAGHKPTSWLDARYDPRGAAAGLALVFGA